MKTFSSPSQKTGKIGEDIACIYLEEKGFTIAERNYTKKWGEIDIVAYKDETTHFIEVKTVSCESFESLSRETDSYRPEEQVHHLKRARLSRIIETYVSVHATYEWVFDVLCVYLDGKSRKARVKFLDDLIL